MLPVVVGLVAGAYAYKCFLADGEIPIMPVPNRRSILDENLIELSRRLAAVRTRRVMVVGQPGAGKSALVDLLTNESLAPRPVIGPMTDQTDWSHHRHLPLPVARDGTVWVDSPGYGTQRHPVASFQEHLAFEHVDRLVVAFSGKLRDSDDVMLGLLRLLCLKQTVGTEVLLVRTQCESLNNEVRRVVRDELHARAPVGAKVMLVSSRTGEGLDELRHALR